MVALQNQTNKPGQAVTSLPWAHRRIYSKDLGPLALYNRHSISFHFHIFFIKLKINKTKHFSDSINQLQREYV